MTVFRRGLVALLVLVLLYLGLLMLKAITNFWLLLVLLWALALALEHSAR